MDRMITNAPSHSAAPESTTNADLDAKSSQATIYALRDMSLYNDGWSRVHKDSQCLCSFVCILLQNKDHLRRYLDSLLKNTTKLKTLQRDIKTNYEQQSSPQFCTDTSCRAYTTPINLISNLVHWETLLNSPQKLWASLQLAAGVRRPWRITSKNLTMNMTSWMSTWPKGRHLALMQRLGHSSVANSV